MITYIEDKSDKYPPRTFANAYQSDATIAFAFDFNTAGERLTKIAAINKIYIPIQMPSKTVEKITMTRSLISSEKIESINIAGNSLPVIKKYGYSQHTCDELVHLFLNDVFSHNSFDCRIKLIRSGGQSGFDESGIKAALKLGIPAICHFPKGWKFINEHGQAICDEKLFKKRFEV